MNSLDITILLIMTVTVAVSTVRGAIREMFSLASVFAGFLLAVHLYRYASEGFLRITTHPEVNAILSFLAIFIFTAVLISFIGGRLSEGAKKSGLGFWDHMFGTVLGTLKGVVICTLIVYALLVFLPAKSPVFVKSKAFPYVSQAAGILSPIAPRFFRDEFQRKMKEFYAKPPVQAHAPKGPKPSTPRK